MGTLIFDIFGLILFGTFIIELIQAMNDDLCNIREIQWENQPELRPDRFDLLYMNVADGDSFDRDYWLGSMKGGEKNGQVCKSNGYSRFSQQN